MKAILILNEMPSCCEMCRLSLQTEDGRVCFAHRKEGGGLMVNKDFGTIPSYCELIEINDNIAHLIEVAR